MTPRSHPSKANTNERSLDLEAEFGAHPYAAVALAMGVGYLLAGGLFTSLTARLLKAGLRFGFRVAVAPALENEIARFASSVLEKEPAGDQDSGDATG